MILAAGLCGACGAFTVASGCSFLAPGDDELLGGAREPDASRPATGGKANGGSANTGLTPAAGAAGAGGESSSGEGGTDGLDASSSTTPPGNGGADARAPEPGDACPDANCDEPTPPVVEEPKPAVGWIRHNMDCSGPSTSSDSCKVKPACEHNYTASVAKPVIGKTGVSYNLTLRFRGVLEPKAYAGGKSFPVQDLKANITTSPVYEGGAASGNAIYNTYSLQISSPSKTYYLNSAPEGEMVIGFDFTATFKVAAGANVTFYAFSKNCAVSYDCSDLSKAPNCTATTIPSDLTHLASKGQFVQIDIVKVTPAATTPATTAVDI